MKNILVISPYNKLYPPENGGMQRCFYMLTELVKYFHITLLMYQDEESFKAAFEKYPLLNELKLVSIGETYKEPKDVFSYFPNSIAYALRYRWLRKKMFESASITYLHLRPILTKILLNAKIDSILLENSSDIILYKYIRSISPLTKIIYEAHNVDSDMFFRAYKKGLLSRRQYKKKLKTESLLYKTCDGVVCMSIDDEKILKKLNNDKIRTKINTTTIPIPGKLAINGVNDPDNFKILYCGSLNYEPNYEGLAWFYNIIWPLLRTVPGIELLVIGSGPPPPSLDPLKSDPGVKFIGRVPEVWDYYNMAAVVVVPLLSGSGIRLKILEAMAMGVPIVSTAKGAEGISYTNGENIILDDEPEKFATDVLTLLNNPMKRKELSVNGRKLIESKYNWEQTGLELKNFIESVLEIQSKPN